MLKNISFLAIATTLLATGCILSVGDDTSDDVNDDTTTDTTSDTGTGTDTGTTSDTQGEIDGTADTGTTDTTTDTTDATSDTTDATTGPGAMCGWDIGNGWYDCGFEGEDPEGTNPIGCPDGLVDGDPCENTGITDIGCCDANGDNWYCAQGDVVFYNVCG